MFNRPELVEAIASVCHETNRAYCLTLGDESQPSWAEAPQWQRDSAISGVEFHLANPEAPASASHEHWLEDKIAAGWALGPVKDEAKKQHPCLVPFDELPLAQQVKDHLFKGVVHAMRLMFISDAQAAATP